MYLGAFQSKISNVILDTMQGKLRVSQKLLYWCNMYSDIIEYHFQQPL